MEALKLKTEQINATQMKEGDLIVFYGGVFKLGEVNSRDGVYRSIGICKEPSESMSKASNYFYFYDGLMNEWLWVFQGNENRMLSRVIN
ncbi:MAG: hypothetical protein RLZZ469_1649 [Bacteroidota bacterium]